MDTLRLEDPYLLINHAYQNNLYEMPEFSWMPEYLAIDLELSTLYQIYTNTTLPNDGKVYKFGVEVPRNPNMP